MNKFKFMVLGKYIKLEFEKINLKVDVSFIY